MFLFIFESIGTSELILIGIIALIFLGPRKLPQIAKTIGKTMADFRNTTNEFKSTWEKEVNFEEEEKALRTGELSDAPVARTSEDESKNISLPEVKEIDKAAFDDIVAEQISGPEDAANNDTVPEDEAAEKEEPENEPLSNKRSWL